MVVSPLGNMFLVGGVGCARCVVISLPKCVLTQNSTGYSHHDSVVQHNVLFYHVVVFGGVCALDGAIKFRRHSCRAGRGHAMVVLDDGMAVVFGGWGDGSYMDDIYKITVSGTAATWVELSSSGDTPTVRFGHAMAVLGDGTAVVFGGRSIGGRMNDIFQLAVPGTSATWVELSSIGDIPSGRSGHAMASSTYAKNDICSRVVSGATATLVELFSSGDTPVGWRGHSWWCSMMARP